mgnify:FL=1
MVSAMLFYFRYKYTIAYNFNIFYDFIVRYIKKNA